MNWPPFFGPSRGRRAWVMSLIIRVIGGHSYRWQCQRARIGHMCQRAHGHPGLHRGSDGTRWGER